MVVPLKFLLMQTMVLENSNRKANGGIINEMRLNEDDVIEG
jgi:hypothetical protein